MWSSWHGERTVEFPLTRATVQAWTSGDGLEAGWRDAYASRLQAFGKQAWVEGCSLVCAKITTEVWSPLVLAGVDLAGVSLTVVPGGLAGLPLHAAVFGDRLLVEEVSAFSYAARALVGEAVTEGSPYRHAVVVLSDPKREAQPLDYSVAEVVDLCEICSRAGATVELLADAWGRSAGDLLDSAKRQTRATAGESPTRDALMRSIREADFFVYSGHGEGLGSFGGQLLLPDGEGGVVTPVSVLQLLSRASLPRSPGVVLSACETSMEMFGPNSGTASVSATFLRLGAAFVLGSQWRVLDRHAGLISRAFTAHLLGGTPAPRAFILALRELVGVATVSDWGAYDLWMSGCAHDLPTC